MSAIELALDWTPNTNHTGIYVADSEGYYDDAGLDVTVRSPAEDDYDQTPAKRVATGESTVAIAPSESALSYHTHPDYESLTAIAAVCQQDTSAIVALGDSDIDRPADLDGQTYASYDARFEDHIVEQLVRNDGGDGDIEVTRPPKLGIWNTLVDGDADATWVFMPWEGVLAERDGIDLTPFYLDDYGVPYGYTPVMLARPEIIETRGEDISRFLEVTGRGYEFAADHPEEAAQILGEAAEGPETLDDEDFLVESQRRLADNYLTDDGTWGEMNTQRWTAFVEWLADEEILTTIDGDHIPASEVTVADLYTNDLL
ncbi:ABC-type nitrate/sulfonate/bicarbonate transport system, substrate-binding protein [Halovenus aranensis]|jgi:NitT/TauT family transport system substrate-binding protein|uniref:Thiamine pyrimidine synthase n=1 Tax=Halovenus aranensis TaxID=890420 RepID=A0A1G8RRW8_9EURY|nr:ABC transporter substrate-binding protein [Halovenus aranensis]SDJ19804.1 ABC-type nitrate/sulfonate/bicarbonate transport system, substrate-binding protein [Halovenus aranensis]